MNEPEEGGLERGAELERTLFFSDGVFAIAITLPVLDIRLPGPRTQELSSALLEELWPDFYSFLISFWFVGTFWMAHHRVFHYIRGYDRGLHLINLFFLMWIVLLPFSSTLLGQYEDQRLAVILYAAHVAIIGLALACVWEYASRRPHLMDRRLVHPREFRYNELLALAVPLVFALSIGVSFVSVRAAELTWLLAFFIRPALLWIVRRSAD